MVRVQVKTEYRRGRDIFRPGDILLVPESRARELERRDPRTGLVRAVRIAETAHTQPIETKAFVEQVKRLV